MYRKAMFNWNQRPKQIAEMEANPSMPNRNEIGTQSPSAQIIAKLVGNGAMFTEAILH
jgi:hypothetical protein